MLFNNPLYSRPHSSLNNTSLLLFFVCALMEGLFPIKSNIVFKSPKYIYRSMTFLYIFSFIVRLGRMFIPLTENLFVTTYCGAIIIFLLLINCAVMALLIAMSFIRYPIFLFVFKYSM